MNCRHCGEVLTFTFIDLASAPPSNAYLNQEDLHRPELYFPLRLFVCHRCWLVQTEDFARADELFSPDYAYFSSTSTTWLEHAARYSDMICSRLRLNRNSYVIEIASNDGYLLKNFVSRNIPCLGIEPTDSTAAAAEKIGIPVLRRFFGKELAQKLCSEGKKTDLVIGNNVLAHVPDLNDFVAGLKIILKPTGTITMEFPHLIQLVDNCQFDTIYHEHFSYLSFMTVQSLFRRHGLELYDVEELPTHGGSLRIYGKHEADRTRTASGNVDSLLKREREKGLAGIAYYRDFQSRVDRIKYDLLKFLIGQKEQGGKVAAYGAAAKGNTLLNYCGIRDDLVPFVVDASPSKQGKYLPGSHIRIVSEKEIKSSRPDFILILPWNIREEIIEQLNYVRDWGGRFVVSVPNLIVLDPAHDSE